MTQIQIRFIATLNFFYFTSLKFMIINGVFFNNNL